MVKDHEWAEMKKELRELVAEGLLTRVQVDIVCARRKGVSYEDIEHQFDVSGPTALCHCLVRTARGMPWWPGMKGGADEYLCPGDEKRFKEYILAACNEVNCVTAHVALALAFTIAKNRASRARKLLVAIGSEKLVPNVRDAEAPSRSWINSVCRRIQVKICRGQELEVARRLYCDRETVISWFLQFSTMFDRSPLLMFNMDETYMTAKRTVHCLAPTAMRPLVTAMPVVPHMTGVVTVSATGERVKPLIILPRKKTLRSLEVFGNDAYFAGSTAGWMTKAIFRYFAMIFVAEVSFLRTRWPKELQDEPVLLFVDGHPSRWDFRANLLFYLFNIDVVTFPRHCSHLLQMFDVAVANPLKTEFKKLMTSASFENFLENLDVANLSNLQKKSISEVRSNMIDCFISACQTVCSRSNCRSAFAATGVFPYCPARALDNQLVMEPPSDGIFPRRSGKANSKFLTSEESLAAMFQEEKRARDNRKSLGG